jgi:hypothetical protein
MQVPGCVTTDTIVLVVNPNPNASANIDQTTICDGESVQLEVSGTLEATIGIMMLRTLTPHIQPHMEVSIGGTVNKY